MYILPLLPTKLRGPFFTCRFPRNYFTLSFELQIHYKHWQWVQVYFNNFSMVKPDQIKTRNYCQVFSLTFTLVVIFPNNCRICRSKEIKIWAINSFVWRNIFSTPIYALQCNCNQKKTHLSHHNNFSPNSSWKHPKLANTSTKLRTCTVIPSCGHYIE